MEKTKKIIISLLLVIMAFLICYQCGTNPIKHIETSLEIDSSVFIYIAKAMKSGMLPYKDIFDHKGPLLYLINYIGILINNNYIGIYIIEVIFMLINLIYMYKITKLFIKSDILSILTIIIVNIPLTIYLQRGNFTEEYALPFIIIPLYYMVRYIVATKTLSKKESFIIGICISCVLLLRPNMISIFIVYCPIIFVDMIKNKKYNEAKNTVIYFLLGLFLILGICIIILQINGILKDCIKEYIIFNFTYMANGNMPLTKCIKIFCNYSMLSIVAIFICIFNILYKIVKKKDNLILPISSLIYIFFTIFIILLSGRIYLHYEIILIPTLLVPMLLVVQLIEHKKSIYYIITFIYLTILINIQDITSIYYIYINPENTKTQINKNIVDIIKDKSDIDENIIVLGNNCSIYLESNRKCSSKYIYQYPIIDMDEMIQEEVENNLKYIKPKLIIYDEDMQNNDIINTINVLIDKKIYNKVDEIYPYTIFERIIENE